MFAIDKTINLAWDRNELQERLKSALDGAERYRTYAGLLEQWFIACGRPIPAKMPPAPTSQPAEPKVMPSDHAEYDRFQPCGCVPDLRYCDRHQPHLGGYAEGDYRVEWRKKPHPPQPSEQAKGAEILVSTWMEYCERLMHEPDRLELVARIQNFIESERAKHKAEMEAVKKGARP